MLLGRTDWAALQHARGSAADLPAGLALFLDGSLTVRTEAIGRWLEVVNHQNSIYQATTPVARYVAALLADPRTAELKVVEVIGGRPAHPPLRAVLIDWLGSIADDASDTVVANMQRLGFDEYPEMEELRSARPVLLRAVEAFLNDADPAVRHAAITAALLLLDTSEQRDRCRGKYEPLVRDVLATSAVGYYRDRALNVLDTWGQDTAALRAAEPQRPYSPHVWASNGWRGGQPLHRVFRDVIAERFPSVPLAPQAALLFGTRIDPTWDDRKFLSDFYNDILHQDTCGPHTAEGVPLLAAIATDDRVPARHRFDAVDLLFDIATVSERHLAQCWPDLPPHADAASEEAARTAVHAWVPELLGRWGGECPAVRLALAGLAVVFPTERTLAALTPRLQGLIDRQAAGTDVGDYARFVLVLAAGNDEATLTAVESLTDTYWKGTARAAPLRGRALHLLRQMLAKVNISLAAC